MIVSVVFVLDSYTVSQKTSHLCLAITLTHVDGFRYFWQKCYR